MVLSVQVLILLLLFQIKHLVVDWLWQPPYEYLNKGTWLHPGGLQHAAKHLAATYIVLALAALVLHMPIHVGVGWLLATLDGVVHYLIDWSKMNINKRYQLTPTNSENFWRLVGVDQFLHQATYIAIVFLAI